MKEDPNVSDRYVREEGPQTVEPTKAEHVKKARQDRRHTCHWPGCEAQCPPAMWGCKTHWFRLPKRLRDRIWDAYIPGQEQRLDPSDEYLTVAHEVQDWIRENAS